VGTEIRDEGGIYEEVWKELHCMSEGWIKLNGKILKWEWWDDPVTAHLFVHILLKANWKDGRWRGIDVPRGSFITSTEKLANETGLSIQQIRTALKKLEETGEVNKQTTSRYTHIFVQNYCLYQDEQQAKQQAKQQANNKQITNKQQANNKQATTIEDNIYTNKTKEEGKTLKDNKTYKDGVFFPNDEKLNSAFADFVDNRKKLRKPMTDKAIDLQIKKINELSGGDNDKAIALIENAIMRGWLSVFPIKEQKQETTSTGITDWSRV
jgi:DNA-binding transcriptional regulator YhcF (GntR family)